jgi:F0F1-type ATP synthase membrane subunit c/vacuolar-type H+-ATPase subunit K
VPAIKRGTPHYIGHPATAKIVESYFGAQKARDNLYMGLLPGLSALVVSIKQGRSSRSAVGKTVDQDVTVDDLVFRVLTRVDDGDFQIL